MKKICWVLLSLWATLAATAQTQLTNKYAMKLAQQADGSFELLNRARYERIVDLSTFDELLVPYTYRAVRLQLRDYKGVETREIVYRTHAGYELQLAVDLAVSDGPAPVVFYCHGGGWARGDNGSQRSLSQYLAKQHGITGVRINYTLAPQPGATVEVSIDDVLAAVQYVRDHAAELNADTQRFGFVGTSAGAHLAAVGAMRTPESKVFVGYSGIYDLETAAICQRSKDPQRIAYFLGREPRVLRSASPESIIPKKTKIAAQLFCGTADITVECGQSRSYARALGRRGATVDLQVYEKYDHGLNAKGSDKMEEIFFKTVDFMTKHLK